MKRYTTERFERRAETGREPCRLRAQTYNLMRVLLARAGDCVFVPIRPMQYLAVVDAEEVIFVDGQDRRWIVLAWQKFTPAVRTALDDPVPYEAVYYGVAGREIARRLAVEFPRALQQLSERNRPIRSGQIAALAGRISGQRREGFT